MSNIEVIRAEPVLGAPVAVHRNFWHNNMTRLSWDGLNPYSNRFPGRTKLALCAMWGRAVPTPGSGRGGFDAVGEFT